MILTKQIYQSKLLLDIPHVIHGFTAKDLGDMRDEKNRKKLFLNGIFLKQVHGNVVHTITKQNYTQEYVSDCDGAVYAFDPTIKQQPILLVHVADCVPVLAINTINKVIGVAHAGWRGTHKHIIVNLIKAMVDIGASVNNIKIVIGPHICVDCYNVDSERANAFTKEFSSTQVVVKHDNQLFLDLTKANILDAINNGITESHIDADDNLCTFHQSSDFFSYRKNNKKNVGEIMGFIAYN